MKKTLLLIALVSLAGCTAIPTDMAPKFTWSWSKAARDYRASKNRAEQRYEASTNEVTNPQ